MGMEGVGAHLDLVEIVVESVRCPRLTHSLENCLDFLWAAELAGQKRQVWLAFRRCRRIEKERPPACNAVEVRVLPTDQRYGSIKAANADEAPWAHHVRDDFDC